MDDIDFSSVRSKPEVEHEIVPQQAPSAPQPPPKKTAKATKAASEPIESVDRTALLNRLKVYAVTFPAKLKGVIPKSLDKLSDEELERLNEQVGLHMGAKGGIEGLAMMMPNALKMVEDLLAMFTPLRIQGTHQACLTPDMQDAIKCALIDAGFAGISMTPIQKITGCLLMAASQRHMLNTAIEAMSPEQRQAMAAALQPTGPQQPTAAPPEDDRYANL